MIRALNRIAFPIQGWIGLTLIAIFWPLNWTLPGLRTAYLFFPLWFGYILLTDAWVLIRSGTSLLTRSPFEFIKLFLISAPAWWLFEVINWRTRNWVYLGGNHFSGLEYTILATLSFSTVIPAVFETAELVRTVPAIHRLSAGPRIHPTKRVCAISLFSGVLMIGLMVTWPRYFYPLVWGGVLLILESMNVWLGNRHLLDYLKDGDWRPLISLAGGALICGFFWEMWNYYSFPKWIYDTPGANFAHVFEMPLLGFLGYIPFAWELFALRSFIARSSPPLRL